MLKTELLPHGGAFTILEKARIKSRLFPRRLLQPRPPPRRPGLPLPATKQLERDFRINLS